jgi:hypothetical protein
MTTPQAIASHCEALTTIADKARTRSPHANEAATLAIHAITAAKTWLTIATTTTSKDPFELADEADEQAA